MGSRVLTEALSAAHAMAMAGDPLSDRSWRVLVVMAHRCMDAGGKTLPARTYARGWEWLALEALNYDEWKSNGAPKRAIARALSDLTERKLIRASSRQTGGFTRYEVLPPG